MQHATTDSYIDQNTVQYTTIGKRVKEKHSDHTEERVVRQFPLVKVCYISNGLLINDVTCENKVGKKFRMNI